MVSGIDVALLRPDEELKRLARLALELGVARAVKAAAGEEELRPALARQRGGRAWLADFDETKDPWFYFSYGNGLYHHHRSWIDDTTLPIAMIGSYIERLEAGEDISRPYEAVLAERDRITAEYRALLSDETMQAASTRVSRSRAPSSPTSRTTTSTSTTGTTRSSGTRCASSGRCSPRTVSWPTRKTSSTCATTRCVRRSRSFGSSGAQAARGLLAGPAYWPPIVERRKAIYEAMREWVPPPALGPAPEAITEPITVMLWGITGGAHPGLAASADGADGGMLTGFAASPGVAEGRARVILRPDQLGELEDGEILVAPSTSTSWTPVFGKIAAAVLDTGGIMCHAAIVAREYGLPAVVGTGTATKRIKTGDRLRVDANAGVVTILG